jgi:hypothetical protein
MIEEVGDNVVSHVRLLYDPMDAVIRIGSRVPELTSPAISKDPCVRSLMHFLALGPGRYVAQATDAPHPIANYDHVVRCNGDTQHTL